MNKKKKLYDAAYDTYEPLYVKAVLGSDILDKLRSWDTVDPYSDYLNEDTEGSRPNDVLLNQQTPKRFADKDAVVPAIDVRPAWPQASRQLADKDAVVSAIDVRPAWPQASRQFVDKDAVVPAIDVRPAWPRASRRFVDKDAVVPVSEHYSRFEDLASPRNIAEQLRKNGSTMSRPEFATETESPELQQDVQLRGRYGRNREANDYTNYDTLPEGMQSELQNMRYYGANTTPAPLPTDNLRVEQQDNVPMSYKGQSVDTDEIVAPRLSAEQLRRDLQPDSPLMSYISKELPRVDEPVPSTMPSDNTRVSQQPVLPPEVAAKGKHVGLGMDDATSFIDGLRVALERTNLSWDYIEAQARRFMNGEVRLGKEYERALQQVTKSEIDSDEKLQQQMDALVNSPRISDKEDAWALLLVKKLRNEGVEWDELPDVLSERVQLPGEASREIESISRQYADLPETEGGAAIADIGANIVGAALPAALALAVAPEAVAVAGTGAVVSDVATTIADAQMKVDAYERQTGKKVSDLQRGMYVTAATATNVLMDVLINSSVLGKALPSKVGNIADELMEKILSNPVAQAEFNAMTRHVLQKEARAYAKETAHSALTGAATSGALTAEESIYTGEFPELQRIVNSTLGGFVMGGVAGGTLAGAQAFDTHRKRYDADNIYYASRTEGPYEGRFPMEEIRDMEYREDGTVEGLVYEPNSKSQRQQVPADNIVTGSYREAVTGKSIGELMHDNYKIPKEKLNYYRERWEELRKSNTHEAAMEQNEILQDVAASMGVPIKVYERYEDLPRRVKQNKKSRSAVGLTVEDRDIYMVLPMCNYLTFDGVLSTLRHELVGHRGLHRLYETRREYNEELDRVGEVLVQEENIEKQKIDPNWKYKPYDPIIMRDKVEESFSRTAEKRRYDKGRHKGSEGVKDPLLIKSDRNMRNATVNEQRAGKQWFDGFPMPTILEIEERRKRKQKKKK